MFTKEFEALFEQQVDICRNVLCNKAKEYALGDRLHNFKSAAVVENITPEQALAGMMAKHTISIYDMISTDDVYPIEMWQEKITDSLNYLFLLNALVREKYKIKEEGNGKIETPHISNDLVNRVPCSTADSSHELGTTYISNGASYISSLKKESTNSAT